MDDHDPEPFKPRRKPLSRLEERVLINAGKMWTVKPKDGEPVHWVAQAKMTWPKSLHHQLYRLLETPRGAVDVAEGLWSVLPDSVCWRLGIDRQSPTQRRINLLCKVLTFTGRLKAYFQKKNLNQWVEEHLPAFRIESSDWLVAATKWDKEEQAKAWLHACEETFNTDSFVEWLRAFDTANDFVPMTDEELNNDEAWESDEQQYYHGTDYYRPVFLNMSHPLPQRSVVAYDTVVEIARLHGTWSHEDSTWSQADETIARLRDRGYAVVIEAPKDGSEKRGRPNGVTLSVEGFQRAVPLIERDYAEIRSRSASCKDALRTEKPDDRH